MPQRAPSTPVPDTFATHIAPPPPTPSAPAAANENRPGLRRLASDPRLPDDLQTDAARHRATLDGHVQQRHQTEAVRLLKRLDAAGDVDGARALAAYAGFGPAAGYHDNDKDSDDFEQVDLGVWDAVGDDVGGDAVTVLDTDSLMRSRPTLLEIKLAAPSGTTWTIEKRRRRDFLPPALRDLPVSEAEANDREMMIVRCGTLVFDITPGAGPTPWDDGKMIEYARTSKGSPRRPSTVMTEPRGGRPGDERSVSAVWRYLSLPPAVGRLAGDIRPMADGAPVGLAGGRTDGDKRIVLMKLGVDGDVDFEDARLTARRSSERFPVAIAKGAEFGGVVRGTDDSPSRGAMYIPDDPREALSPRAVAVLEIVLAGGTLTDIGRYSGAPESTAGRRGIVVFDEIMTELKDAMRLRPANDNALKSEAA